MKKITLEELRVYSEQQDPKTLILDVRTKDEFTQGFIEGALNIPLGEEVSRMSEIDGYNKIIIHCLRGGRAQKAYRSWSNINKDISLEVYAEGGFYHWQESGYPIAKN